MERLTARSAGLPILDPRHEEKYTHDELIDVLLGRLALYEDIGLTPGEVESFMKRVGDIVQLYEKLDMERFKEILQAAEDGRLFISPVKVGDMIWPICWDGVLGAWVVDEHPTRVNEVGTKGIFVSATIEEPEAPDEFHPYEEIGDVYFWSREEAVNAAAEKERPEEVQGDGE